MRKSVASGKLVFGDIKIPVKVYLGYDTKTLDGHSFHEGCNAPINQLNRCSIHTQLEFPATYSGICWDDQIIKIDSEVRDSLLERSFTDFKVKSSHKLIELAELISSGQLVMLGCWEACIEPNKHKILSNAEIQFSFLLQRLIANKMFLLAEFPLAGMRRNCVLVAQYNGHDISCNIFPLLYQEEIRPTDPMLLHVINGQQTLFDSRLKTMQKPFPILSMKRIESNIAEFFARHTKAININRKKIGAIKSNVGAKV